MNGGARDNLRHSLGRGIVTKLVRDDASADANRGSDLMQCNSQIVAEPRAATRTGKEKAVNGR
jgi:hypothetical protein